MARAVRHPTATRINAGSNPAVVSMENKVDWKSPEVLKQLHENNDCEVAASLGVTRQRVQQIRKKLGIISKRANRRVAVLGSGKLGTISDAELGSLIGEDPRYVALIRRQSGLKAYHR